MLTEISTFGWFGPQSDLLSVSTFGWFTTPVSVGGTIAFAGAGFTLSGDFGIGATS